MISTNSANVYSTLHQAYAMMSSESITNKFYDKITDFCSGKSEARKQSNFTVFLLSADRESASKVERELICKGYIVRNPLRLISDKLEPQEKLRESMKLLLECNAIYLCPKFSENSLLKLQYQVANMLGLSLFESDILDTEMNNNNL